MTQLNPSPPSSSLTGFDRTTHLEPRSDRPDAFSIELTDDWSSLVGVHGGYQCAIAVRAAERQVPDRAVRTITTNFLQAARVGPAAIEVRVLRHGGSISVVAVDLWQGAELVNTSRLTLVGEVEGVEWGMPVAVDLPPIEVCTPPSPPTGIAHFGQAEARLDPGSLPFSGGPRARLGGYVRPIEQRPIDSAWLAMACDWFPPAAFVRVDPPTGGVSVDLTTHIHRPRHPLAEDEWLRGAFEVVTSSGGLAVEHGRITDPAGVLLAESFQTRWTARR